MSSMNMTTNNNRNSNIKPSPEDMEVIFNYMIENNLSSYSNRADCVDDGPDLGEWPTDNSTFTQANAATSSATAVSTSFTANATARGGFQSPRHSIEPPEIVPVLTREQLVDATVQKIAGEVNAFFQRKASGNLTEQDKERIWRDGTEEDRLELGAWRPPSVSSLPPLTERIQKALAGFAALEKECAEKDPLLNYSDDALYN
jgi:hypothetical protein